MTKIDFINYIIDLGRYNKAKVYYTELPNRYEGFFIESKDPTNIQFVAVWDFNRSSCNMNSYIGKAKKFVPYDEVVSFIREHICLEEKSL